MSTDPYTDRASQIFQRINNIQTNVGDERHNRFKLIETILQNFESNLNEIYNSKNEKLTYISEKLRALQLHVEEENKNRLTFEEELTTQLNNMERNCRRKLETYQKARIENDQKNIHQISQQIEMLQDEIQQEYQNKSTSHPFLQQYLEVDLPQLKEEVNIESILRRDIEQKVYEQFMEQISELKSSLEEERKERENKEEELIGFLQSISLKVRDQLTKTKGEREENEEMMIKLVEQVIEKMRYEMAEYDL